MSGAGDIHHALHDTGTQNQQEVPQPLSSHHRAGQSLPTALVSCLVATNLYALHECNQDCDDWLWEDQPVPVISVTMLAMVTVVMMMVMTGH